MEKNGMIKYKKFSSDTGADEFHLVITTNENATFKESICELDAFYSRAIEDMGLHLGSDFSVFSRLYLSDIENQKEGLLTSVLFQRLKNGAVSVIQQPPLSGGSISLYAYFVRNTQTPLSKTLLSHSANQWLNEIVVSGKHYSMVWSANYAGCGEFDSGKQSGEILKNYNDHLKNRDMNLLDNTIRSWIYVRDIDNHYGGMVNTRREYFIQEGLTDKTRYLASTGIEGKGKDVDSLVSMDMLSFKNIKKEQIIRMEALDNMPPTIKYGVTFERGICLKFGDRSHFHISGTASIDKNGNVAHPGNVEKQTIQTINNIKALLAPYGAGLEDLAYINLYLRDACFYKYVKNIITREIPSEIPIVVLKGSVCRPGWLVEIDGIAIKSDENDFLPFL